MMFLDTILLYIKEFIASIGVLVISLGALRSLYQLMLFVKDRSFTMNSIRLQFGNSVILGLEFMVGGDIVGSLIKPDYYNLGMLAILVVIRTILSYFLNLELACLSPEQKQALQ
jgi:uncharacterized membrane protein